MARWQALTGAHSWAVQQALLRRVHPTSGLAPAAPRNRQASPEAPINDQLDLGTRGLSCPFGDCIVWST
jgi:hypothetical protein